MKVPLDVLRAADRVSVDVAPLAVGVTGLAEKLALVRLGRPLTVSRTAAV